MDLSPLVESSPINHLTIKGITSLLFLKAKTVLNRFPAISNGPIEGINNKIKVLKRVAYGFSNFSHFRDRILLMTRLFKPEWSKKDYAMNSIA